MACFRLRAGPLVLLCLAWAKPSWAQTATDLALHGFGGWAAGYSDNDNRYGLVAAKDVEFDNHYFALNLASRPRENLSVNVQLNWHSNLMEQKAEVDYAFVEGRLAPWLRLRLGKVKSPFGLYTETFDVGTLRPFFLLPQSMYAGPGFVSKSYEGAGVTGSRALGGGWEVQYDAFGGELHLQDFEAELVAGVNPQTRLPIFASVRQSLVGHDVLGARLLVAPPLPGLQFGASVVKFHVEALVDGVSYGEDPIALWALHAEYLAGKTSLRAEYFQGDPGKRAAYPTPTKGAYVEAARKLGERWQLGAVYEWHREKSPRPHAAQLDEHDAWGLALNYWPSSSVAFELNCYSVKGNLFAKPLHYQADLLLGKAPDKTSNVVLLGTQFSF